MKVLFLVITLSTAISATASAQSLINYPPGHPSAPKTKSSSVASKNSTAPSKTSASSVVIRAGGPASCAKSARTIWSIGGGDVASDTVAARLCTQAKSMAPFQCFREMRKQWGEGGGGVGSEDRAVNLCSQASDLSRFHCFRKARMTWENGGGGIGDEDIAIRLCKQPRGEGSINCFRQARKYWEHGGGTLGIELSTQLCAGSTMKALNCFRNARSNAGLKIESDSTAIAMCRRQ